MKQKLNYITLLSFFLYFVLLIAERTISVVMSFTHGVNIFDRPFHGFVYITIFLSLAGFLVFLLLACRKDIKALFHPKGELGKDDFRNLILASGILLLSGMVHSEYTISGLQFASYGVLIVGMIIYVINHLSSFENKGLTIIGLVYLVCYSMAIPVTYESGLQTKTLIHIIEGIGSYLLVASFTCMFICLFKKNIKGLFSPVFLALAIVLDVLIIALEWKGNPNIFVMIFIIASTVIYALSFGYRFIKKRGTVK